MLTRGYRWQSTQLASSPASPEPPLASGKPPVGTYTYYDARMPRGRERNEAEEQAATRACDAGDPDRIGTGAFNSCMRTHGWRFASFAPNPPAPAAEPASPVFDEEAFDEEQRGNEEQRRNQEQIQDMINTQQMLATQEMINNQQMLNTQQQMLNAQQFNNP
ncbi:MAG: hypothetical protein JOY94_08970 [Methylobacteriaceae bacterium]|nr:hypothetical protein [Methylobacteriaceae bacterium]